jgi:hypothetical protein
VWREGESKAWSEDDMEGMEGRGLGQSKDSRLTSRAWGGGGWVGSGDDGQGR